MLEIRNLCISYGEIPVVRNVELEVHQGEIVGIVGESGCGKSTTLETILMLNKTVNVTQGEILFKGMDIIKKSNEELRTLRGKDIAMIFQNAPLAMDPLKRIEHYFYETVQVHRKHVSRQECKIAAQALMEKMGLKDTARIFKSYPFELSGGMCQRVAIAGAMMNQPELILADEPTSALDVMSQAQVVRQLQLVRDVFNTAILIVSHNIGVIAHLVDKVAVMYSGEIIEWGSREDVLLCSGHPYTQALIESVPKMNGPVPEGISGQPPEYVIDRQGCGFALRCRYAKESCQKKKPEKVYLSEGHWILCDIPNRKET